MSERVLGADPRRQVPRQAPAGRPAPRPGGDCAALQKKDAKKRKVDEKVEVGFDFVTSRPLPEVRAWQHCIADYLPLQVLPGVRAVLRPGLPDRERLARYLVAYGGRSAEGGVGTALHSLHCAGC